MAVGIRGVGAASTAGANSTSVSPPTSSAPQSGDVLIMVCESSDSTTAAGTPNTPSGWTKIFERTEGDGATGVTTLTVFAKIAGASESAVTVDGVLNHIHGQMIALMDTGVSNVATDIVVGTGTGAASGNMASVAGVSAAVDDMILLIGGTTRDAANTATWSAWAIASGVGTVTERMDSQTNTGTGGGFGMATALVTSAGTTGNGSATIAVSVQWNGVQIKVPKVSGTQTPKAIDASMTAGVALVRQARTTKAITATLTVARTRLVATTKALTATLTVARTRLVATARALGLTGTAAAAKETRTTRAVTSTMTAATAAVKVFVKEVAASLTAGVAVVKQTGAVRAVTATMTVARTRLISTAKAITSIMTAAVARQTQAVRAVGATLTSAVTRRVGALRAVDLTAAVTIVKRTARTVAVGLAAAVEAAGVYSPAGQQFQKAVDVAATFVPGVTRRTQRVVGLALTAAASVSGTYVAATVETLRQARAWWKQQNRRMNKVGLKRGAPEPAYENEVGDGPSDASRFARWLDGMLD